MTIVASGHGGGLKKFYGNRLRSTHCSDADPTTLLINFYLDHEKRQVFKIMSFNAMASPTTVFFINVGFTFCSWSVELDI